jgi:hypothetical protein
MALSITHSYVSAVPDAGDASLVQPSDWNDVHDISGLGTGVETFLGTPSSANLASAVTDETGSGALVFANTPTLVTPVLGAATGTSVVLSGKLEAASIELSHASANTLTASAGVLSIEGVPVLMSAATGVQTFLTTPSSANLIAAVTDETGTGALVFANTPTLVTPVLGAATGTSIVLSGKLEAASIELGHASANTLTASGGVLSIEGVALLSTASVIPLTVGTSTIASGNDTRILYNNAGVLGQYTLTGTGTVAVMQNTPTLTTPVLGAATATSIQFTDATLVRYLANNLAVRNGTTAQSFTVFATYTDDSNFERFDVTFSSGQWFLQSTPVGTGSARGITIRTIGDADLLFGTSATTRFYITGSAGHFLANADNTYDIGASGATRPRTLYLGTMLRTPKIETPRVSELTIATGAITATGSYHSVDTEADAASDDLDTINGGTDGMRLVLRASDSGRTVVVKDGTGNIQCGGDFSLDNIQDTIELIYDGVQTAWLEIGRSDNGA